MPISTKSLVTKINTTLADSSLSVTQRGAAAAAAGTINNSVVSVATITDLPSAATSTGRLIYVKSICDYRYSTGLAWTREYNSTPVVSNTVWAWGCNDYGQLGDGTTVSKSSPVSVVGGVSDWCQVSAGSFHTEAVRINCTAWAWGWGIGTGDGTAVNKSSPVLVAGGFTNWCQVSAGYTHTVAVRIDGTAWSWGYNLTGQLGDNTIVNKSSPVLVVGGFTNWCQVSAGYVHTAAIRTTGSLWTWGKNHIGELGDGTSTSRTSPVSVVGGFTDWCQVSAGCRFTVAVRTNGTAWGWGYNSIGNLGDGSQTPRSSPGLVAGGFSDWCQVSAAIGRHTAAVRTNGTIWTWGFNLWGNLGDATTVHRYSPVLVAGGFTNWCQVSAGYAHTAAIRTTGSLWTWGKNHIGELGDGTTTSRTSPVSVVGGFTDWCQVSAGRRHTAAVRATFVRGF